MSKIEKLEEEIETLRMQLVGCGVAALGGTDDHHIVKKDNPYWSASYQDVLDLRIKHDKLIGRGK